MKVEMTINLSSLGKLRDKFSGPEGRRAVNRALQAGALLVENHAKRSILAGGKTGRTYGKHRASAPGQPPASDTGNLVGSILSQPGSEPLSYEINARAFYAAMLEYGTSKMAPRPFMKPALEANRQRIVQLVRDALK